MIIKQQYNCIEKKPDDIKQDWNGMLIDDNLYLVRRVGLQNWLRCVPFSVVVFMSLYQR